MERFQHAACWQNQVHDHHVRELRLQEGQLVYLLDFSGRQPHKIQGQRIYERYRVLWIAVPKECGSVYTRHEPPSEEEPSQKHDLLVFGQQPSVATSALPLGRSVTPTFSLPVQSAPDHRQGCFLAGPSSGALTSPAPVFISCPYSNQEDPRQTA